MASLCQRAEVKALKSRAEDISLKEAEEELTIKIYNQVEYMCEL